MSAGPKRAPRISVLIPTIDERPTLRHAIDSVLDQDFDDFELVISDNGTTGAERRAIEAAEVDPRVRVARPAAHGGRLPLTQNWNAALSASEGGHVLLLGDDDALVPGALARLDALLSEHGDPDCITYNGFRFVAPDSMPGLEGSFYAEVTPYPGEGPISAEERLELVRGFYSFDLRYELGYMQLILVGREAIARLADGLFNPPFPDFYALAALMLRARRWIQVAERLAIVGISPTSVSSLVQQGRRDESMAYLGEEVEFPGAVPGNGFVNAIHRWLLLLQEDYPEELGGLRPDRGEYLTRQLWSWYRGRSRGSLSSRELLRRVRSLSARDWASVSRAAASARKLRYVALAHRHRRELESHMFFRELRPLPGTEDLSEFRRRLAPDRLTPGE